jgi:hypothetical protein
MHMQSEHGRPAVVSTEGFQEFFHAKEPGINFQDQRPYKETSQEVATATGSNPGERKEKAIGRTEN